MASGGYIQGLKLTSQDYTWNNRNIPHDQDIYIQQRVNS